MKKKEKKREKKVKKGKGESCWEKIWIGNDFKNRGVWLWKNTKFIILLIIITLGIGLLKLETAMHQN